MGAHGDIFATTMIFQARESTRSRRSTGSGLMVTAWGSECHINMLTDDLGVNPEHMIVPRAKTSTSEKIEGRKAATANKRVHKYVKNMIHSTEIISPNDERVKLTETMKKECEGKTIYYNKQHVLESGEDFKLGVAGVQGKENRKFERMLPKNTMKQTRTGTGRSICSRNNVMTKISTTSVSNCGTWTYTGVTNTTTDGGLPPPPVEIVSKHYHTVWTVAAQCCNQEGTNFFPCAHIPDGDSHEAEQAFSTAFAKSLGKYYHYANGSEYCMGMSRYCEWDSSDTTYADIGVSGACTSHCKSYCSGFQKFSDTNAPYPNGCFKCYGMHPGFYDPNNLYLTDPYFSFARYGHDGPCTP